MICFGYILMESFSLIIFSITLVKTLVFVLVLVEN